MSLPKSLKEELREAKKIELENRAKGKEEEIDKVVDRVIEESKEVELSTKKIKKNGK